MDGESMRRFGGPVGWVGSLSGVTLDAVVVGILGWIITWVVLDFHSHIGGLDFAEEGFLTPEHTMFYGGFLALFLLVGLVSFRRYREGEELRYAPPPGYRLGLLGLVLFALGGPADAVWHSIFGAEANVEALVSPTHLLLATGGVLFGTAPLRAAWHRGDATGVHQLPALVAATFTLTLLSAFTLYLQPAFVHPGSGDPGYGLASVLVTAALVAGAVVTLLRFRLVPGGCTLVLGVAGGGMAFLAQSWWTAVPFVVAGALADALVRVGRPAERPRQMYAVVAAVPAALVAGLFVGLAVAGGVSWSTHLVTGGVYLAGCVGLLVAFIARTRVVAGADASRSESL
jgi:hypothetical protein